MEERRADYDRGDLTWGLAQLSPLPAPGDPADVSFYLESQSLSVEGGIALAVLRFLQALTF